MEKIIDSVVDELNKILNENFEISKEDIEGMLETPKDKGMGDVAIPCFRFAKQLRQSPVQIALNLKEKLDKIDLKNIGIEKIEAVSGYLNFYVLNDEIVGKVLTEIITKEEKYIQEESNGKTVCIDYSSPNIAKPFHIGHLRSTVIGAALINIYKTLGYNTVGINYLGDFGTQFGYVIEGYKRWQDKYDLKENPIKQLVEIYVKINELAKEDESIVERARANFKLLEEGDEEITNLWKKFRALSLEEYIRIYERLGIHFDSFDGEAYYNDKMQEVIDMLDQSGHLVESRGAKVVELEKEEVPCMILKSNGSSTYATRDLAAILDRTRRYNFEKCLYLTGYEQGLHFSQVFEVAKYLVDEKYVVGLTHVPFGMVLGPGGKKLSTRKGASTTIEDVIDEVIEKAKDMLVKKGKVTENIDEVASMIGIGAVIFNDLKNSRIKDEVFDMDEMLKFEGETGPYTQYTYVRTNSIIEKSGIDMENIDLSKIDFSLLSDKNEVELVKVLAKIKDIIKKASREQEPSVVTRYLIDVATAFTKYYNECQIIVEDSDLKLARLCLVYSVKIIMKQGLLLLGIKCPEKM